MRRLSVRWQVALGFAGLAAVVLGALGAFVYVRVERDLTETLDRGLKARADEVVATARRSPAGLDRAEPTTLEADESVAQVLRADGTVVSGTSHARASLLTRNQLARALRGPVITVDREGDAKLDERVRLRGVAVVARGERLVAVVGASLDERDEALWALAVTELVGLLLALGLISVGGYVVAGRALAPERAALARERRFVADASHELRTPLTILRTEIDVALLEEPTVDGLRAALRSTGEEAQRMTRLTADLLLLAQADEGRLPIRREPVDVGALLERIAARPWSGRVNVRASVGLELHADVVRLEQALTNLVDNALRHGRAPVELGAERDDGHLVLTVRDHGPGLPAAFAERAFERFARADPGRAGGGTGLGLAIVRAIAEAHGGTAELEDAEPGTVAILRLPHRALMPSSSPSSA